MSIPNSVPPLIAHPTSLHHILILITRSVCPYTRHSKLLLSLSPRKYILPFSPFPVLHDGTEDRRAIGRVVTVVGITGLEAASKALQNTAGDTIFKSNCDFADTGSACG